MAADKVLSALTAATVLASTDIVYVMQSPSGTALDRKCTVAILAAGVVSAGTALIPQFAGMGIGEAGVSGTITATRSDAATTQSITLKQASTGDVGLSLALTGARAYSIAIDNSDSDSLKISTGAAGTADAGTGDLVTVLSGGNVGIGTTSPSTKMHIVGASPLRMGTVSDYFSFTQTAANVWGWLGSGGTYSLLMDGSTGSAGIGGSPSTNFHVQESNTDTVPAIYIVQASTGDAGLMLALSGGRAFSLAIDNSDSDILKISTGAAGTAEAGTGDLLYVTSSGRLGIGISPLAAFHVIGDQRIQDASATHYMALTYATASGTGRVSATSPGGNTSLELATALAGSTAARVTVTSAGNVCVGTSAAGASSVGVLAIANGTAPSANITGIQIYAESGAAKVRGSGGTITTFGPAEPHCPQCGRDFMHEWQSDRYGYLAACMWCLTEELGSRPYVIRKTGALG